MKIIVHYLAQVRQAAGRATAGRSNWIGHARCGTRHPRRPGAAARRCAACCWTRRGEPQPALLLFVGDSRCQRNRHWGTGTRSRCCRPWPADRGTHMEPKPTLSESERGRYEWQLWVPGFGERGTGTAQGRLGADVACRRRRRRRRLRVGGGRRRPARAGSRRRRAAQRPQPPTAHDHRLGRPAARRSRAARRLARTESAGRDRNGRRERQRGQRRAAGRPGGSRRRLRPAVRRTVAAEPRGRAAG